ncbi:MAG: DNA ligase D [Steroidobacteraceae bacterium]|jgi:bifunctional non-homologous end joining protein LigD|nr:DNA ligase D [Steroidobacteraceae bacterium]
MASTKLSNYRAKRDFSRTSEPSGRLPVKPSSRLRFVVQKHAARRLHYDLRLELDGVFRSWAVTRGPSLDPADKRLAVEVEDHPLDYGDFEGVIPKGQYGGGSVQLWDRGYWRPLGDASPQEQLLKGELKFALQGERLRGAWVMVRMKGDRYGGKRTNWLLMKQRDVEARDQKAAQALLDEDRSIASGRSMQDIASGKGRRPKPFMLASRDLARADAVWSTNGGGEVATHARGRAAGNAQRTGASKRAASPNRAKAPPQFIEPQLCKLLERPPQNGGWGHEVKFDGYRMQLRVADGETTLKTRNGLDWTDKFGAIAKAARALGACIIDGEIVALDENGAPDFAALQAALSDRATDSLVYFAFDLLYENGEDLRKLPLRERKARLKTLLSQRAHDTDRLRYTEHFETAGDAVLQSACRMNLEGVVSKRLDAPYRSGRGDDWIKTKCRGGQEVVIGGWTQQSGQLRSLLVGVHRNGRLVYVGKVGTGFGRQKVARLMPRLKALASKSSPFSGENAPRGRPEVRWVKPQLVAEIEFAGWTAAGQVRQAAFKGLREDKPAREVAAEAPAAATTPEEELADRGAARARRRKSGLRKERNAPERRERGRTTPSRSSSNVVLGVPISNPDKQLWPNGPGGSPITKLDLARYFESTGEWLMTHIAGRPCSIIRAPDGVHGGKFFQRHAMRGVSNLITLKNVAGDHQAYLQFDRPESLIAAAQSAAVELHPWNCQPHEPDEPGRLVFDLDPGPDVQFEQVIEAARELRERLETLGLETFCKTTGGKGLHVVTPLARTKGGRLRWPEAKSFAQAVCAQMAQDSPSRYLINMAKRLRGGRIFLDYLRNDRMSTAVAPLSPRARDGAPVSMPINWSQARSGLDPQRYTIRSAAGLLSKATEWRGYCEAERPLEPAIRKLLHKKPRGRSPAATRKSREARAP